MFEETEEYMKILGWRQSFNSDQKINLARNWVPERFLKVWKV